MLDILIYVTSTPWRFAGTIALICSLGVPIKCLGPLVKVVAMGRG